MRRRSGGRGTDAARATPADRPVAAMSEFSNGASVGCGSLPHRDAVASAAFAIGEFDVSSVPMLPNLSGPRAGIVQAVAGLPGARCDSGRILTDAERFGTRAPIRADLDHVSFAGLRAFLGLAGKIRLDGVPVAWHFVGPITLGIALNEAGLDTSEAFALALRIVRTQLVEIGSAVADVLPRSPQLVMLDEPALADLMSPDFPIPPDQAVDLMSSGMAAVAGTAMAGIQCSAPCDLATMLASGPGVISVPVDAELVDWAGYVNRFLEDGGVVAWGVIPTSGPVATTAERYWRALSDLWCELVRRGCDPVALRRQSMVTPGGNLDRHSVSAARRTARMTAEVSKRVKDQANATRFALGA